MASTMPHPLPEPLVLPAVPAPDGHVAWDVWIFLVQPTGEIEVVSAPAAG